MKTFLIFNEVQAEDPEMQRLAESWKLHWVKVGPRSWVFFQQEGQYLESSGCFVVGEWSFLEWQGRGLKHIGEFVAGVQSSRLKTLSELDGEFSLFIGLEGGGGLGVRDLMGTRPLFYLRWRGGMIFSNNLAIIRNHLASPVRINDSVVGDYLLFGFNYHPNQTFYEGVYRVPASHFLETFRSHPVRYVALRQNVDVPFRIPEVVETFQSLLKTAVQKRLHSTQTSICMSGGMDSTSVAMVARQWCYHSIKAFHINTAENEEFQCAEQAAQDLGLPFHPFIIKPETRPFALPETDLLEPDIHPFARERNQWLRHASEFSPVVLTGDSGDVIHFADGLIYGLKAFGILSTLGATWNQVVCHGQIPSPGLRPTLKGDFETMVAGPFPAWIEQEYVAQHRLRERFEFIVHQPRFRKRGTLGVFLEKHLWSGTFEKYHFTFTGVPLEGRFPLFDRNILEFALSLPSHPWGKNKFLLRETVKPYFPQFLLERRKVPLEVQILELLWKKSLSQLSPQTVPAVSKYVDLKVLKAEAALDIGRRWPHLRAVALAKWLEGN